MNNVVHDIGSESAAAFVGGGGMLLVMVVPGVRFFRAHDAFRVVLVLWVVQGFAVSGGGGDGVGFETASTIDDVFLVLFLSLPLVAARRSQPCSL